MRSKKFKLPRKKIVEFCKRWSITEFSLLGSALRECLQPEVTTRAHEVAGRMRSLGCVYGARIAAERLMSEFG